MKKIITLLLVSIFIFLGWGSLKVNASDQYTVTIKHLSESGYSEVVTTNIAANNNLIFEASNYDTDNDIFRAWLVNGQFLGHTNREITIKITENTELISISARPTNDINLYFDHDLKLIDYIYYTRGTTVNHPTPSADVLRPGEQFDYWLKINTPTIPGVNRYRVVTTNAPVTPDENLTFIEGSPYKFDSFDPSLDYIDLKGNLYLSFSLPTYLSSNPDSGVYNSFQHMSLSYDSLTISNPVKIMHSIQKVDGYDIFVIKQGDESKIINLDSITEIRFKSTNKNGAGMIVEFVGSDLIYQIKINTKYNLYFSETQKIESFSALPKTNEEQIKANITKLPDNTGYQLTIDFNDQIYMMNVDMIPEWLAQSKKVYYMTNEDDIPLLIGFYEGTHVKIKDDDTFDDFMLKNSYIVWNLESKQYQVSETQIIHGQLHHGKHSWATYNSLYVDIVIPHKIDNLTMISVNYDYHYKFLDGSKSKTYYVRQQILVEGQDRPLKQAWWLDPARWVSNWIMPHIKKLRVDEIQEIQPDLKYKADLITYLEATGSGNYRIEDIFQPGFKTYQIFLGQYDRFWTTGVWATNFAVVQYRYDFDGVQYSNPFPITNVPDQDEPDGVLDKIVDPIGNLLNQLWGLIVKFSYIIMPIVGLLTAYIPIKAIQIITGKKKVKGRALIVIAWAAIITIAWMLIITRV